MTGIFGMSSAIHQLTAVDQSDLGGAAANIDIENCFVFLAGKFSQAVFQKRKARACADNFLEAAGVV